LNSFRVLDYTLQKPRVLPEVIDIRTIATLSGLLHYKKTAKRYDRYRTNNISHRWIENQRS